MRIIIQLLLFPGLFYIVTSLTENSSSSSTAADSDEDSKNVAVFALNMHRILFKTKRYEHKLAVEQIRSQTMKLEKREAMLSALLDAMKKQFLESRVVIERSGFIPGMPFPHEETREELKDAVSKILENVAFFADLALYFPDFVLSKYYNPTTAANTNRKNKDFRVHADWAVSFANSTGFYDEQNQKLLHLAGQELGLVEKESTYVNPYRASSAGGKRKIIDDYNNNDQQTKSTTEQKKKQKKKLTKGPRLQGGGEL